MKRALLVDDDEKLLAQLARLLEHGTSCVCDTATTDTDACAFVRRNAYDVVILDLGMDDGEFGLERQAFCVELRSQAVGARFVGMTGLPLSLTQAFGLGRLLDDFVEKRDLNAIVLSRLIGDAASRPRRRFRVALSYSGKYREQVVAPVAGHLAFEFGWHQVFYDKFHETKFMGLDADVRLQRIYGRESDLVVVFLAPEYAKSDMCQREWHAIRAVSYEPGHPDILPIRVGGGGALPEVAGFFPNVDLWLDATQSNPRQIADWIIERVKGAVDAP